MEVQLQNISKRFQSGFIFKNLDYTFRSGGIYGIAGANGSGKSSLMKIISGYLSPTTGTVIYTKEKAIDRNDIFKHISLSAPYLEIEEEFKLFEQWSFFEKFQKLKQGTDADAIFEELDLLQHKNKQIKNFSSGMKQRVQLALALHADVSLVLLDEPTSFLDTKGKEWFYQKLSRLADKQTIIIASNDEEDLKYCKDRVSL